jgi:anti-sigma B factor antagonist
VLHHCTDALTRQQEGQMPQNFDIDVTIDEGELVVRVAGDLDLSSRAKVVDEVSGPMAGSGVDSVALDLGRVAFCDSSGLGALLDVRRAAGEAGVDLVLRNVPPSVARLLDLTDVDGWLTRE